MGQKSLSWIRLIMICYTVPWWPSWLSDQIAFCLKSFKSATIAAILHIGTEKFSNSKSPCQLVTSHQIPAQSDLLFGRRCGFRNFKMAAMAAIVDIGKERF